MNGNSDVNVGFGLLWQWRKETQGWKTLSRN